MRKIYISTISFFENLKKKKRKLIAFGPVAGVMHYSSLCYEKDDNLYCILVNDEEMMTFMLQKATEMMNEKPNKDGSIGKPVELVISRKRRSKHCLTGAICREKD